MLKRTSLLCFLCVFVATAVSAQDLKFVKVKKNGSGVAVTLETAVVRYEDDQKNTIDLVGAVHIGDQSYYNGLNKLFKDYDVLCYELVAEKGTIPKKNDNSNAFSLQGLAKSILDLEHQLEIVDYQADNFVHADMTPEQMSKVMEERGDNQLSIALGAIRDNIRKNNLNKNNAAENEDITFNELINLLSDPAGPLKLKRKLAVQLSGDHSMGETIDQLLITDRNEEAMRVVLEQLNKGHKKIGLFYGAAHMPDFHKRLSEMGYEPVKVGYIVAWNMLD